MRPIPVLVTNGTGSGNYNYKQTITIVATVPSGMVFDYWQIDIPGTFLEGGSKMLYSLDETIRLQVIRKVSYTAYFRNPEDNPTYPAYLPGD